METQLTVTEITLLTFFPYNTEERFEVSSHPCDCILPLTTVKRTDILLKLPLKATPALCFFISCHQ